MKGRLLRRRLARDRIPLREGDTVIWADRSPRRRLTRKRARVPAVVVRAMVFRGDCVHVVSGSGHTHRQWRRAQTRFVLPPTGAVFGDRGPRQCVLVDDGHDTVVLDCDLFGPVGFAALRRRIRNLTAIARTLADPDATRAG